MLELLCRRDPHTPRAEHHASILCGEILVDGQLLRDPKARVDVGARVAWRAPRRFASRGGLKLDGVLADWGLEVRGLSFLDVGASTGGFTDCLLQRGASRVCAVEAGANQLAYRLRVDPRVTVLERTGIMSLVAEDIPFRPDAAVADLSLRSLRGAAGRILRLVAGGWLIALVKPQYEMPAAAAAGGVVRKAEDRLTVLRRLAADLAAEGAVVVRIGPSRLPGAGGNLEYFFQLVESSQRDLPDLDEQLARLAAVSPAPFGGSG